MNSLKAFTPILIIFLFFITHTSKGQGCSDAGICSATQNFSHSDIELNPHSFTYTQSFGLGDRNAAIISSSLYYRYVVNKTISFGLSLPYSITIGNLGTTQGIGDIILNSEINLYKSKNQQLALFIGGKIATNDANKQIANTAVPMIYQQSSGTNDMIIALNYSSNNWFFAAGYQHAFNTNKNEFLSSDFPVNSLEAEYHSSAFLKRGDDIMFRAQRIFNLKSSSKIKAGVLPIFRIQQDEIEIDNVYQKVANSTGLTLNLYAGWMHHISKNISGELQIAAPPITREVRVDGTTRTFLINYVLNISF